MNMFKFALLLGIFSYLLFALGLSGLLYEHLIIWLTLSYWGIATYWRRKSLIYLFSSLIRNIKIKDKLFFLFFFLLLSQALVNLIGALGPELAFDALWYHLTIPKIWLSNHQINFIPGGLLYYSAMPKLAELLYTAGLAIGNELLPKLIHFSFGLLTCIAIYKLARKFFAPIISLLAVIIFYFNLVVGWESITAYIDLTRTFFEVMALWAFINWWEAGKKKWIIISALMVGFAITTKILALSSLLIFTILILYKGYTQKHKIHLAHLSGILLYWTLCLMVPMPWFIFSYFNTGNPIYPFFTEIYQIIPSQFSMTSIVNDIVNLFIYSPDPLSPLYFIFLPLIIFIFTKFKSEIKIITIYSIFSIVLWNFTPRTGGGRFILPYLPAMSIICAACLHFLIENKKKYGAYFPGILIIIIIVVSLISISYRFIANAKYLPVILGRETKHEFLVNNLNFSFGDFYDTDKYFEKNIKSDDKILLFGFHNLYYVDFQYIDSSWQKDKDKFNYIATQNIKLPEKYKNWKLIYVNEKTMVKLYK